MDHRVKAEDYLARLQVKFADEYADADGYAVLVALHELLAVVDVLERIDDALRNTVGGRS